MPDFGSEHLTKVVTLALTPGDFPIVEREVTGYGMALRAPPALTAAFAQGAHAVILDSPQIAASIPDYGGTVSGGWSLPFHRDDTKGGRLRYLGLSRLDPGTRTSSTVLALPETAFELLSDEEHFFRWHREKLREERNYDPRFAKNEVSLTEDEYDHCFEPGGYDDILVDRIGTETDRMPLVTKALNLLGYLIRGPLADRLMDELAERYKHSFTYLKLSEGQVGIFDNEAVFHGRIGLGDAMKRNFFVLD